jgi:deoxyribodipyrimidine photo-lyase
VGQLNENPQPLGEDRDASLIASPIAKNIPTEPFLLLITEEDCLAEPLTLSQHPTAIIATHFAEARSQLEVSQNVMNFSHGAIEDASDRASTFFKCKADIVVQSALSETLIETAKSSGVNHIVTSYLPVGPAADAVQALEKQLRENEIQLHQILRPYDEKSWPHATRGFFKLKEKIPRLIAELELG